MPGAQAPQQIYTIEQLVALNPYNPDILPDLESYVEDQAAMFAEAAVINSYRLAAHGSEDSLDTAWKAEAESLKPLLTQTTPTKLGRVQTQAYSLDCNLCLLRLYQFQPARMNVNIIIKVLVKALMALPATDFNLCMFLIPERLQMEETFLTLATLAHFLETSRFREFWDEANRNRDILEVVPGFEQAIQGYAIHVLSITYQRLPRSILAEAINVEGLSLDKFLEHQVSNNGWALEKGGKVVVLPLNEDNQPVLRRNTADSIPLEHVAKILPVLV